MSLNSDNELLTRIERGLRPLLPDRDSLIKASYGVRSVLGFLDGADRPADSTLFDFEDKINRVVEHFAPDGLTRSDYVRAAVKQPSLFCQRPETVIGNIEGVVRHFAPDGLTRSDYVRAAVKQPSLFTVKPETVIGNIEGVVRHFAPDGLTSAKYLRLAVKRPALFYQRPETVIGNIEEVARHFAPDGLTRKDYLGAALRQPQLFCQKPKTIFSHVNLIESLYRDGSLILPRPRHPSETETTPIVNFLIHNPQYFCLSDDNFGLREIHAKVTQAQSSPAFLIRPRKEVESELARALGHADQREPVAKIEASEGGYANNLLLRALIREGWVQGRIK
jgi:hypothetical protein